MKLFVNFSLLANNFVTGLGSSYEYYRTHPKWPCRHLLEAILRKTSGDRDLREAVVCMEALAYDFGRFQDVFIKCDPLEMTLISRRRESEVLVSKELDLKCFSPSKPTFLSSRYCQGPENHGH